MWLFVEVVIQFLDTTILTGYQSISTEIGKVLSKISKENGCEALSEWIKPCQNHLCWRATFTFSGNGRVIWAKFRSFLSHILNRHEDLDDPLFNRCAHGSIKSRKWLQKGKYSIPALFICASVCVYIYNFGGCQKWEPCLSCMTPPTMGNLFRLTNLIYQYKSNPCPFFHNRFPCVWEGLCGPHKY